MLAQYGLTEEGRRFQATSLLNPNPDRPNLTYDFHGHHKVWRWTKERMEQAEHEGRLYFPKAGKGVPREKRYLDEQEGYPLQDVWIDKSLRLGAQDPERLGYPTQKPTPLLERLINASSNPCDVVLDPFCGCGTAIAAAQKLGREWIGIDITHLAITLIKHRLRDAFGDSLTFEVIGEPVDQASAVMLAEQDPYQFQWWVLGLVGARPTEQKKGADRGIDGRLYFYDDSKGGTKQIIFSVKAGHLTPAYVRDLHGVIEREKAQIGVLLTMEEPTREMRKEAASAGFYDSWGMEEAKRRYPRLQILTVEELLGGKGVDRPPSRGEVTFKKAPRVYAEAEQGLLALAAETPTEKPPRPTKRPRRR